MGRYLVVENSENNNKSISYLMADIIRDIAGNENFEGDWHLSIENVAKCVIAAKSLFDSDAKLRIYIDKHKDNYWATSNSLEEIKKYLWNIFGCLADNLAIAILYNKKFLTVWWEG